MMWFYQSRSGKHHQQRKGTSYYSEVLKERTNGNCCLCGASIKQEPIKAWWLLLLAMYFGHPDYLVTKMKKHVASYSIKCVAKGRTCGLMTLLIPFGGSGRKIGNYGTTRYFLFEHANLPAILNDIQQLFTFFFRGTKILSYFSFC